MCEELKQAGRGGSTDQKRKAEHADQVQGKMFNWLFALSLSVVTDVYKLYRLVTCCLQKIDVLPHEKYDSFKQFVGVLLKMESTVSVSDCPCNEVDLEEREWKPRSLKSVLVLPPQIFGLFGPPRKRVNFDKFNQRQKCVFCVLTALYVSK